MSENGHSEFNGKNPENGRFLPGNPGKPVGAQVTSTKKIKAAVQKFLEENIEQVQASFDKLTPLEKLQFITALLPYAVPKLQSIDSNLTGEVKQAITVRWDNSLLPKSTTDSPPQESPSKQSEQ